MNIKELLLKPSNGTIETVINSGKIDDEILHYFATDCAERALDICEGKVDPRSIKAIEVKRLWLQGLALDGELEAATRAARDAWSAARATRAAARAAAEAAAAGAAARAATRAATRAAAWAAWADAWAAWAAARAAAGAAAEADAISWQCQRLLWWLEFSKTTNRLWEAYE